MTGRLIRRMGPSAFLVECDDAPAAEVADQIRSIGGPGAVDVVPAARTVLVDCVDEPTAVQLADRVRTMGPSVLPGAEGDPTSVVEIAVRFDGADLADVAERTERSVEEVVTLVVGGSYGVDFCGFAPGFAYLSGLHPSLHLPRRGRPRTRVPAGSFAIAAGYAAVYPAESPGGWHLLGTTDAAIWTLERDPPALLTPGTPVRFTAITDG